MKLHIKVIQRNGVDVFVTSSMTMKETNSDRTDKASLRMCSGMQGAAGDEQYNWANNRLSNYNRLMCDPYLKSQRVWSNLFADLG